MLLRTGRIARKLRLPSARATCAKAFLLSIVAACGTSVQAQEPSQPQQQKDQRPPPNTAEAAARAPMALFMMLDRKSIVFPDIAANSERLSAGQKFGLFVDNSVSLHGLAEASLGAGLSLAADSPSGYGQGGVGYGKRFGASMARLASSNFFGTFLLASALHQDPRFFPLREPSIGRSVSYSLERVVVTRNDDGRDVCNWSGLLGPLLAESLANAYWPESDRNVGWTFRRYGVDLGTRAGTNLLREYWPVIARRMHHRGRGSAAER